jgi:hypothetical protein
MQDFIFSPFVDSDSSLFLQEVKANALIYKYVKSQIIYFVIPRQLKCSSLYIYIIVSKRACSLRIYELSQNILQNK